VRQQSLAACPGDPHFLLAMSKKLRFHTGKLDRVAFYRALIKFTIGSFLFFRPGGPQERNWLYKRTGTGFYRALA
jgi:hypothetical protein